MTDDEMKKLIGPFKGDPQNPYYRPFAEYQHENSYNIFLVGINPATSIYPEQVNEEEYMKMLRDAKIFKEKYSAIRMINNKTKISRTRMGIESLTRELEAEGEKVLQTNIISYPTPSVKKLRSVNKEIIEESLSNFLILLTKQRPSILILYSKTALNFFLKLLISKKIIDERVKFDHTLKVMEEQEGPLLTFKNPAGSEVSVFVCRHLMYYGEKGESYKIFKNKVFKHLRRTKALEEQGS